jgi:hypothetical protein
VYGAAKIAAQKSAKCGVVIVGSTKAVELKQDAATVHLARSTVDPFVAAAASCGSCLPILSLHLYLQVEKRSVSSANQLYRQSMC